jgi:hypothetical protein
MWTEAAFKNELINVGKLRRQSGQELSRENKCIWYLQRSKSEATFIFTPTIILCKWSPLVYQGIEGLLFPQATCWQSTSYNDMVNHSAINACLSSDKGDRALKGIVSTRELKGRGCGPRASCQIGFLSFFCPLIKL